MCNKTVVLCFVSLIIAMFLYIWKKTKNIFNLKKKKKKVSVSHSAQVRAHRRVILRFLYLPLPPPCLCTVSWKNVYNMIVPCIHRRSHSCILNVNKFLLINSNKTRLKSQVLLSFFILYAKQTNGDVWEGFFLEKQVRHKLIQAVFLIISKWHLILWFFFFVLHKSLSNIVVWIKVIA